MSKKTIGMFVLAASLLFSASFAYAHGTGHSAGGHDKGMQCPIAGKFMKKADFLLKNKKSLGLTDEQVKSINDMKTQVEKDSIRQSADAQTFMIDLRSKLKEDKIDVDGTNAFIDKSFASMAEGAKSNLQAYAKLKALLTPEQVAKMKELHKDREEHEGDHSSKNES